MTISAYPENLQMVCRVAAAAISRAAAYTAEMTSQLLFGETCVVTGPPERKWLPVRSSYDGYEGYVLVSQLEPAASPEMPFLYTFCPNGILHTEAGPLHLPLGTVLNRDQAARFSGETLAPGALAANAENIKQAAALFGQTPYLWGGKSTFGTDCSGFTQTIYRLLNIPLPRDAWQQAEKGEMVGFLAEARTGDLAFFDDAEGRIVHTGILLDTQTIIHSAGNVHTDPIDHAGIVNARTGERTHNLRTIKRIIPG